jgi:hypothetical protein
VKLQAEIFAMYKALRRQGLKPMSSSSSTDGSGENNTAAAPAAFTCVPVSNTREPMAGWSAYYDSLMRNITAKRPATAEADLY